MFRLISDYLHLRRNQYKRSKEKIERIQFRSLKKMFDHAVVHSPFYKELYKDKAFNQMNDFYLLPTIDKTIMMENFSLLNTVGIDKDDVMAYAIEKELNKDYLGYYQQEYVVGLSSGTSGNKGLYITPKSLTKRLPGVFLARSGLSLKDLPMRILFCLRVFSQGFNDINAPFLKLNYTSTMIEPEKAIEMINNQKTNILMAPPSFIRTILHLSNQINVKLKKIITYAEVLTDSDKEQFNTAFKTDVIEIYQASEGQIASSCHLGKLHINEDLVFVELYDENNQLIEKPDVVGYEMIVTNLINRAQPLIRYRMNDMIVLDEPCSCGSSFRTIKKIIGRNDDLIYFIDKDGNKKVVFPDLIARWIITESDLIREFQVIQEEIGKISIHLDLLSDFDVEDLRIRLDKELKALHLFGTYEFIIGKIDLPKYTNKYKRFISKLQ